MISFLDVAGVDQLIELREISESVLGKKIGEWIHEQWKNELEKKSTLSIRKK